MNCEKYADKAQYQKNTWLMKLPETISYFHVLGNPSLQTEFEFDHSEHILWVKTKDDYVSLPHKVISAYGAVQATYDFKYIFKTDDDQNLVFDSFFTTITNILQIKTPTPHYGGNIISIKPHVSTYYTIHPELPHDLLMKATTYSSGRFYFLSRDATETLLQKKSDIAKEYFEDYAIGLYLDSRFKENALVIKTDNIFKDIIL
jgi:hypothetical protein